MGSDTCWPKNDRARQALILIHKGESEAWGMSTLSAIYLATLDIKCLAQGPYGGAAFLQNMRFKPATF